MTRSRRTLSHCCLLLLSCCYPLIINWSFSLSHLQVNLDHVTQAVTKENMEQPSQSCFDLAQSKIYTLMEKDCYPRFLKSSTYLELTRKSKTG